MASREQETRASNNRAVLVETVRNGPRTRNSYAEACHWRASGVTELSTEAERLPLPSPRAVLRPSCLQAITSHRPLLVGTSTCGSTTNLP